MTNNLTFTWIRSLLCGGLLATSLAAAAYEPNGDFLKDQPHRKTKQVVSLSGVQSDEQLAVVKDAINDVSYVLVLFAMLGSNLEDDPVQGMTPQRAQEVRDGKVPWSAFRTRSTEKGLSDLPIKPASGYFADEVAQWRVQSPSRLSVSVKVRLLFWKGKPVPDAPKSTHRLVFTKVGDRWLYDGTEP